MKFNIRDKLIDSLNGNNNDFRNAIFKLEKNINSNSIFTEGYKIDLIVITEKEDAFYKKEPCIVLVWDKVKSFSEELFIITLAHELGHHVIEDNELYNSFKGKILEEYNHENSEDTIEEYKDDKDPFTELQETLADFISVFLWDVDKSHYNNDTRINSIDTLIKKLEKGKVSLSEEANRFF